MKYEKRYIKASVLESGVDVQSLLQTVKVGDLIKINDWKKPMKVKAVSDNYFVMTNNLFGKTYYSVCCKLPWDGASGSPMVSGMCHCGTDDWVFGSPMCVDCADLYQFNNQEYNKKYLEDFENENCKLSMRTSVAIFDLYVKPCK